MPPVMMALNFLSCPALPACMLLASPGLQPECKCVLRSLPDSAVKVLGVAAA